MRSKLIMLVFACLLAGAIFTVYYVLTDGPADDPAGPDMTTEQAAVPDAAPGAAPATESPAAAAPPPSPTTASAQFRVYGTVTDAETGAGVEDAQVILAMPDGAPSTIAYTNAKGAYEATADEQPEAVICRADGYAEMREDVTAGSDELRLDFPVVHGAVVAGRVVDVEDESAVAGVTVALTPTDAGTMALYDFGRRASENSFTAETEEDGSYRIENVRPGDYYLHARAQDAGYLQNESTMKTVALRAGDTISGQDFALDPGGVVAGTVRDAEGNPLEGARIEVQAARPMESFSNDMTRMAENFRSISAITDAEGKYEAKGLSFEKDYVVQADHRDFAMQKSESFSVAENARRADVDVQLSTGSLVSGRVVYEDGEAAGSVRVMLTGSGTPFLDGLRPIVEETDEEGKFEMAHVPAGTYRVVSMGDFGPGAFDGDEADWIEIDVDGSSPITNLEVLAKRRGSDVPTESITGVVVDDNGRAVSGAQVEASMAFGIGRKLTAQSDADGRFEITELRGRVFDVQASHEGLTGKVDDVEAGADITVQLGEPASVAGFVVGADGSPVRDAEVRLTPVTEGDGGMGAMFASIERMMGGGEGAQRTDANGFFRFESVEPGTYKIAAKSATGGAGEDGPFAVAAGQSITDARVDLTPGVSFSGTVTGAGEGPLTGAEITLTPQDENDPMAGMALPFMQGMGGDSKTTLSGPDGKFTIENVAAGRYMLTADHRDFAKTVENGIVVDAGRDVTNHQVALMKGGRATGVYAPNGQAKAGVMVNLIGPSGMYMAVTEADGSFSIEGIPPGEYIATAVDMENMNMSAQAMGGVPPHSQMVEIGDEAETPVDFTPQGGTSVSGAIDNAPGSMTTVSLRRPGGPDPSQMQIGDMRQAMEYMRYHVGQAVVQPDGSFMLDGVPPGQYVMDIISVDFDAASGDFSQMMDMQNMPRITVEVTVGEEPLYQAIQWPTDADAAP